MAKAKKAKKSRNGRSGRNGRATVHAMKYVKSDATWVVTAGGRRVVAGEDKRALLPKARVAAAKTRPARLDIYGMDGKLQTTVLYK